MTSCLEDGRLVMQLLQLRFDILQTSQLSLARLRQTLDLIVDAVNIEPEQESILQNVSTSSSRNEKEER